MNKVKVAVYDAKPYDREYLENSGESGIRWIFHEFRLTHETAETAKGAFAVCVFVSDELNKKCLEVLSSMGVKLVALRCAGYNNVDIDAAKSLSLPVVRVPAYSPHSVAEHAFSLILCLNSSLQGTQSPIHQAYLVQFKQGRFVIISPLLEL